MQPLRGCKKIGFTYTVTIMQPQRDWSIPRKGFIFANK
jgi:hypothetical protein